LARRASEVDESPWDEEVAEELGGVAAVRVEPGGLMPGVARRVEDVET